ncbi:MAG: ABC transporter substrate-binding protein [Pseudomonadota bacterium]
MKPFKLAVASAMLALAAGPALAQHLLPSFVYRTGPYAPSGIPFADGVSDYYTLLNERDGGVGGVKIDEDVCETAYNTQKGVECYENIKGDDPLVIIPQSTGITYQLIPKATDDELPIWSTGYGRTSAVNGKVFPWVFIVPGTYWDTASVMIKHALEMEGGSLEGKKITLLYHNSAYGKEPIRTLEMLAEKHGYDLTLIAVDHPGQEQKQQWLQIRRERPDFVFMWGWGVMNQVAVQEAANIRFPMERFIGTWFSGSEADVESAGPGSTGYKAATWHRTGSDFPIYEDLKEHVWDKGLGAGDGSTHGEVLYNRGLYVAAVVTEVIRAAQEATGKDEITPAEFRDTYETFEMTEERWAELGLEGLAPGFQVSCADHGAPHSVAIQQWDAEAGAWEVITEFMEPDSEVTMQLVEEDSMAYAKENDIEPRTCE